LHRGHLPEEEARLFYRHLVLGIDYCHKKNICNRDIKLENVLLDSMDGCPRPVLKICDYGLSINDDENSPKSDVGTPEFKGMSCSIPGKGRPHSI
jgi:serine/threonine protein kinase